MSDLSAVLQHIDDHFNDHLERVKTFVRQPSISGEGTGMAEMAALVAAHIREAGGQAEIVPTPGWPVVYGEINAGAPKTLLVYGMYDVQPVAGETWSVPDPFGGTIVDRPPFGPCMINRGVTNSKGPLINFFNVLESFRACGIPYPLNVKFMIEGEEELGSRNLPGFVAAYKDRLTADLAFFPHYSQDATGKVLMHLGFKGIVFMELVARGGDWGGPTSRSIHGANSVWFHNPAWTLMHALTSMMTPDQKHITVDGYYDDIVPPSAEDEELVRELAQTFDPQTTLAEYDVRRFKYDQTGAALLMKILFQPALNINGMITGYVGEATKTLLPHEARAKVDMRLVPNMQPERMIQLIKDHLARHGYADKIEVIVNQGYPPSKLRLAGNPAAQAMLKVYRQMGYEPEIWPHLFGSAPMYLFTDVLKIPTVLGGLGHGARAHSPDEYATIAGMKQCEESIAAFLATAGAE